jgi:hypothetical protein
MRAGGKQSAADCGLELVADAACGTDVAEGVVSASSSGVDVVLAVGVTAGPTLSAVLDPAEESSPADATAP